jgi:alcohol dehydrogenase
MSDDGVKIEEMDQPDVREDHVLVKVMAAGICGTDLAIISRRLRVPLPLVLGHEFTGDVVQIGHNARTVSVGSRVTSEINLTCGQCFFCKSGISTHCLNRRAIGIDVDGAFAEYIVVPVKNIHRLPESTTYEEGVFIEPLAAAIQTMKMSPVKARSAVAVLGDGRLGQLVVQAIKATIPSLKLFMVGKHDSKLRIAKKLGSVDVIVDATHEDPVKTILDMTGGLGVDMVVEATGNPDALNLALSLVRHRGTIALKSTHGLPITVDATQVAVRELTLQGSRCGPFDEAITMLKEGKVKVKQLISARYPLAEAEDALEVAKQPETLKVILTPSA